MAPLHRNMKNAFSHPPRSGGGRRAVFFLATLVTLCANAQPAAGAEGTCGVAAAAVAALRADIATQSSTDGILGRLDRHA